MLHHFLKIHGFGETSVHFHADNCSGQNKNRYLMAYILYVEDTHWSTLRDKDFLFTSGTYKICPRLVFWPFQMPLSLNKDRLSRGHCSGCNLSTTANVAQLVGTQDGSTVVPMYEWSTYFDSYTIKTALKGITKLHHFRFSRSDPGKVFVKNRWSD